MDLAQNLHTWDIETLIGFHLEHAELQSCVNIWHKQNQNLKFWTVMWLSKTLAVICQLSSPQISSSSMDSASNTDYFDFNGNLKKLVAKPVTKISLILIQEATTGNEAGWIDHARAVYWDTIQSIPLKNNNGEGDKNINCPKKTIAGVQWPDIHNHLKATITKNSITITMR